jgi:hypothetical protein
MRKGKRTFDREGRELRPRGLVGYGWETVPEIAARLGREPADVAPELAAAAQVGAVEGGLIDFTRGFLVPMFRQRLPLLGLSVGNITNRGDATPDSATS